MPTVVPPSGPSEGKIFTVGVWARFANNSDAARLEGCEGGATIHVDVELVPARQHCERTAHGQLVDRLLSDRLNRG